MLQWTNGAAKPAVVTDGNDDAGIACSVEHKVRVDNFVADKRRYDVIVCLKSGSGVSPWYKARHGEIEKGDDALYGFLKVGSYVNRTAFELYNVTENRYENVNLAGNPEYAKVLESMKRKLKDFQQATDDPWISKWEYE